MCRKSFLLSLGKSLGTPLFNLIYLSYHGSQLLSTTNLSIKKGGIAPALAVSVTWLGLVEKVKEVAEVNYHFVIRYYFVHPGVVINFYKLDIVGVGFSIEVNY